MTFTGAAFCTKKLYGDRSTVIGPHIILERYIADMSYFSNYAIDYGEAAAFERSTRGYPTRRETLNYYLDDLTAMLEQLDEDRPHDLLHPEYDKFFHSTGRYRYFEVLWADQVTVQDLLVAIAEVRELIEHIDQDTVAEDTDENGSIPRQIIMVGFFHPLAFHPKGSAVYGG